MLAVKVIHVVEVSGETSTITSSETNVDAGGGTRTAGLGEWKNVLGLRDATQVGTGDGKNKEVNMCLLAFQDGINLEAKYEINAVETGRGTSAVEVIMELNSLHCVDKTDASEVGDSTNALEAWRGTNKVQASNQKSLADQTVTWT